MKTLLIFFALISSAFSQATFSITVPGEAAVSVTITAEAVPSISSFIQAISATGAAATTLSSPIDTAATTFTVGSAMGVTTGMGALCNGEVSLITAVNSNQLTVVRGRIGTTKRTGIAGDAVVFLRSGSYGTQIANYILDAVQSILNSYPGPAVTTAKATIATQQAIIDAASRGSVTHVP